MFLNCVITTKNINLQSFRTRSSQRFSEEFEKGDSKFVTFKQVGDANDNRNHRQKYLTRKPMVKLRMFTGGFPCEFIRSYTCKLIQI